MNPTALLVIDIQRGAFDGQRCPPIDQADTLAGNVNRLVQAARGGGTPVVFIQDCEGAGELFEEGTPQWELHESLAPQAADKRVRKYASSAFEGTDLAPILEDLKATGLVLCGLQSDFCVSNTAKSALAAGFAVTIAQDAHGTWPSASQSAQAIAQQANHDLEAAGAALVTTASLVRQWESQGHAPA